MKKMNQHLMLCLFSCLFFISQAHSTSTSSTSSGQFCSPDQSSALLQLGQEFVKGMPSDYYNGSYPKMMSWKANTDCCSWNGVTCDTKNGQVIGLNLRNSHLYGPLNSNSSLFGLRHLQKLNLGFNNFFSSTIPSEFGQLVNLTHLNLSHSFLSGQIPPFISNLSQLTHLSLSSNNFHGQLPSFFGNLTQLEELDISRNQLKGSIPSEISTLSHLSNLYLSCNSLTGAIPSFLFTMHSLLKLDLSQNQLTGPLKFQNISSSLLRYLSLSRNNLNEQVPKSIANLTDLEYLFLSSINVKGKMELNMFFKLRELRFLDLSGNNLLISREYINSTLPKFSKLWLSSCNLREFPDFLEAQNELIYLDLSNNSIEGKIPKWFWNVGKETLQSLNLSINLLSNFEQPLKVLPWKNMVYLDLCANMLQGPLPVPPLSTHYFFAASNNLTGRISPMICKANSLRILELSNNQLIDKIPQCLGNFSSSLLVLNMRNNCFQGNLPKTFIKESSLRTLDLSHNQIQGEIPRSLVQCRRLETLNLGNNNMNGTFPFWLESLPELKILILRANGFHGPIWDPHTKFGFSKLHVIDLSHNNFSGELPSEYFNTWTAMLMVPNKNKSQPEYMGGQSNYYINTITVMNKGVEMELVKILTIFIAIDFSNNKFYGEIPYSMGNLKGLIVLNLSSNSFMSHIPSLLGNLIALESLDMSQNKLFGEIPQQLISITFLEYLNLSQNQLIGPIPQGGQFGTFQSSSFEGNLGLCGSPLLKKCENNDTPPPKPSVESSFKEGFNWKVVVIGYACGLIIGQVIGHFVISRRPYWFSRTFGVKLHR